MAIILPHIEDLNRTAYLPPEGDIQTFIDDDHYAEMVKEWGLSSGKNVKKEFWYKEKDHQRLVTIKGYQSYGTTGEFYTIIIEFQDGNLSCIHPAYLKEMQSSSFGKAVIADSAPAVQTAGRETEPVEPAKEKKAPPAEKKVSASPKKTAEKKEKAPKLELPADKVHFTAEVKQFALTWNPFNEENDEVVVLENVVIQQDPVIEIGLAWCSHSKTLKKLELSPGDKLEFDGKIVKKKLAKGKDAEEAFIIEEPVHYKVNNPSKIHKS
ncbi:hypothetical protein WQ57_12055 [Mesobacillus campisalis]|uniref:Uncharacterized protein n=1 Tax=Mesobacillus campisalis TaxID=1408103 RepID=A0A0M2SW21_9BACI|nr:hypothetical protein [Mesobacillus campisalis]KKK37901.1 hypothetical protein WQ57_12055 [Mesobacillus campisalis]